MRSVFLDGITKKNVCAIMLSFLMQKQHPLTLILLLTLKYRNEL